MTFQPNDENQKFTELYNVQRLSSSYTDAKVTVALNKSNPGTALVLQKITDTGYQVISVAQQLDSIQ